MGRTISQNSAGALIGEVYDRGFDYTDNNVRGHTTNSEIGPHCDTADVVGLLCIRPAAGGGESLIASSGAIYNEILATRPDLVDPLAAGFRIDLAGKGPTGAANEVTRARIPVFSWYAGGFPVDSTASRLRTDSASLAAVSPNRSKKRSRWWSDWHSTRAFASRWIFVQVTSSGSTSCHPPRTRRIPG